MNNNQNKENKNSIKNINLYNRKKTIILTRKTRWYIFSILCIVHCFVNISSSVMSAAVTQIKIDLKINDKKFGLCESMKGLGSLFGTLFFALMINNINHKYYFIICLLFHSLSIFVFTFIEKDEFLLLILRGISGVFCVQIILYLPIWVTRFHIQQWKTFMMTTLQIAGALGMICGYLINVIFTSKNWKKSFRFEFFFDIVWIIFILFTPNRYFEKSIFYVGHKYKNHYSGNENKGSITYIENLNTNEDNDNIKNNDSVNYNFNDGFSIYSNTINNIDTKNNNNNDNNKKEIFFYFQLVCISYLRCIQVCIKSILFSWYSDYLQNDLKIKDDKIIFLSFSMGMAIAPIVGYALGGSIISLIGGYDSKYAYSTIFIFHMIGCILGSIVTFSKNIVYFSILVFGLTLSNYGASSIEVGVTFYYLVPQQMTGIASGLIGFFINLLGYFPSPYVYGLMKSYFGGKNSLKYIMRYSWTGLIWIFMAEINRIYHNKKSKKSKLDNRNQQILLKEINN